jgi:hypothetical protein
MAGKKQARAQARQTIAAEAADAVPADDRRTDLPEVGGSSTPKIDGGNDQHPIHDEDQEDRMPSDYEREIDRIDATTRSDR